MCTGGDTSGMFVGGGSVLVDTWRYCLVGEGRVWSDLVEVGLSLMAWRKWTCIENILRSTQ